MRLSWNEIRARASVFSGEWADATYEKGEAQSFYNALFQVFGVKRRSVAHYEKQVQRLNTTRYIDLFWKGKLLVEHKSAGADLAVARRQAEGYFEDLPERERPRYLLLCDFQTFILLDLDEDTETQFKLSELHQNVEAFAFIIDATPRTFKDQDPVNVEASELLGKLHDELVTSGYKGEHLGLLLVRLVFCLFADNAGIFDTRGSLLQYLEDRTLEDGSDLGQHLTHIFEILNTPPESRSTKLDEDLAQFPYVNGDLFLGGIRTPDFDSQMRQLLLDACYFDWSAISPAIFGSLFQSVMDPDARRAQGAHYTTEQNIFKVIGPLFLDELRSDFDRLTRDRSTRAKNELEKLRRRLGTLRFFDPACGCGNFLIISYRELRLLEIDILKELERRTPIAQLELVLESSIDVDQFYGIEISEFPSRIAATAMWMMDHLMNNRLSRVFGEMFTRIPIAKSPHIHHGDALEISWKDVLPPEHCNYVLGNPPYVGNKLQLDTQRKQFQRIAKEFGTTSGSLDYVAAWFFLAGGYVKAGRSRLGSGPRIAFVATNSITQGQQVGQLWPILLQSTELEISFAHQTFAWGSDARGKAHVHCVIIGLQTRNSYPAPKRLFSYADINGDPHESTHAMITPYLVDGHKLTNPYLVVHEEQDPLNGLRPMITGSKPIDGGNFIFNAEERQLFLDSEPQAEKFLRPYVGAREYLNGGARWILALHDADPAELAELPYVRKRISAVRAYRRASKSPPTQRLADTPRQYHVNVLPTGRFLVLPEVSKGQREYLPIDWLEAPIVPSNKLRIVLGATHVDFALLTSSMHMAWMQGITGRMKSDYQYSVGVVYNTFPLPAGLDDARVSSLEPLANAVLAARAEHESVTRANLYDPDGMPLRLRKAHERLDRAVERLYRPKRFTSDRERFEHLFMLYDQLKAPLAPAAPMRTPRSTPNSATSGRA